MKRLILLVLIIFAVFPNFAHAYYDPSAGRWLSRDPIGEQDNWNMYQYVSNDAANKSDYLGLTTLDITFGRDDTFNGDFDEAVNDATKEIQANLDYCKKEYGTPEVKVNPKKSNKIPKKPKNGYGGNVRPSTSQLGGENNVLFTGPGLMKGGRNGNSGRDWGVVVKQDPPVGTVSHELGHHANYREKDPGKQAEIEGKKQDWHNMDPNNLMYPESNPNRKPDKCWCEKVSGLAK